jgi:FMN phosphatase YigB (HAD superfamily)
MGRYPEMVWLDLDDTLFDHSYSVARGLEWLQQQYPALSSHPTEELVRLYNIALNEVYPDYLSGAIDFAEMRRRKLELFYLRAGLSKAKAPDATTFHRIYDEGYGRERRATPGSIAGVQRLHEWGIAVAVLTNGMRRIQEEKLRAIGFESLVPHLLTSEEAGAAKPDPLIFQWALHKTKQTARNVVMIGDNPVNDVAGACGAGIRAIYYSPSTNEKFVHADFGPVAVLSDWEQLAEVLLTPVRVSEPEASLAGES